MIDSMMDKKFTNQIGKNMQFWIKKNFISKKKDSVNIYINKSPKDNQLCRVFLNNECSRFQMQTHGKIYTDKYIRKIKLLTY